MQLPANSPVLAANGKDTPEYRLNYLRAMANWREETREQAELSYRNSPEFNNVEKYIRYLEGNQLDERRRKYKSRYVLNKIELTRRQRLALLTDSKPIGDVSSNVAAFADQAQVIQKVLQAEYFRQGQQDILADVVDIAMLHGIGFVREGASTPGRSRSIPLGPDNVMPIQPSLTSLQDSVAVLYSAWKPIPYFKKVFPYASDGIESQAKSTENRNKDRFIRPLHIPEYTWSQMSPGFKKMLGGKPSSEIVGDFSKLYGSIRLEEYYIDDLSINESRRNIIVKDPFLPQGLHNWWYEVKPGQRLYPRKRLVIYGGNRLLYDGPSPYWHGMYPFEELRLNPVPWSYYGLSTYRSLMAPQDAVNDIPAGVLDLAKRALNPTLMWKSSVASEAAMKEFLSDLPGARLQTRPNVNLDTDIRYGEVPQVPAFVGQVYENVILPEFDKLSGIVDMAAMSAKNQMPSGDTLNQMQDALQTPLRREERLIETFLQRCGQQKVSNIIQFYTAKQRLRLLGADGITWEDFDLDPGKMHPAEKTADGINREVQSSYWQQFSFQVEPGSMHQGAHDKKKMMALQEVSRGLISRQEYMRATGRTAEQAQQILGEIAQEAQAAGEIQNSMRTPRSADQKNGPSAPTG